MQEPIPGYIPPGAFAGDPPMYDPNGPVGNLIDASGERGWTIGQQFQAGLASPFGYVVGENGTARPAYEFGLPWQPPPGAIATSASQNTDAEFMAALLLMMF